jgi:hypothetical protein
MTVQTAGEALRELRMTNQNVTERDRQALENLEKASREQKAGKPDKRQHGGHEHATHRQHQQQGGNPDDPMTDRERRARERGVDEIDRTEDMPTRRQPEND